MPQNGMIHVLYGFLKNYVYRVLLFPLILPLKKTSYLSVSLSL